MEKKRALFYLCLILFKQSNNTRRKMDIRDQCLDIQLCDKHLTYSVLMYKYSAVISKIIILTFFNILDSKTECSDIATEYPFFSVHIVYIFIISSEIINLAWDQMFKQFSM